MATMTDMEMRMAALLWSAYRDLKMEHGPLEPIAIYLVAAGVQLPISEDQVALSNLDRLSGDDLELMN